MREEGNLPSFGRAENPEAGESDYAGNRQAWDTLAEMHFKSDYYDVKGFLEGGNTLRAIERAALGDVTGKRLLHLQCHFGMDTLSWARLGARVTGVDFSPAAIELAERLAREVGIEARFVCSNVEDLPERLTGLFDVVFTSYGVLCWLKDLRKWARVVSHFLEAGGRFLLVEGHPTLHMFGDDKTVTDWKLAHPYFESAGPMRMMCEGSYATGYVAHMELVEWPHSMSEIVTSLIEAGLTIRSLREFPYCFYQASPLLEERKDGNWWPQDREVEVPMILMIEAVKS